MYLYQDRTRIFLGVLIFLLLISGSTLNRKFISLQNLVFSWLLFTSRFEEKSGNFDLAYKLCNSSFFIFFNAKAFLSREGF